MLKNRGESDYFVDSIAVIDKDFANMHKYNVTTGEGHDVDTVYVVLDKAELLKQINKDKKTQK